jgi:transketolase
LRRLLNSTPRESGKPTFVIADTVKGKGVSFMENVLKWHHGVPDDRQYELAMEELGAAVERLNAMPLIECLSET